MTTEHTPTRDTGRDYGFLSDDPVPLKIWLPEAAEAQLARQAVRQGLTKAALVGQVLFSHLYGTSALQLQLTKQSPWLSQRPRAVASRSPSYRPELGKNIADVRLFIPARMRVELQELATASGLKLSAYARRVILDEWFGQAPFGQDPVSLHQF